jgi:hypothetical protein
MQEFPWISDEKRKEGLLVYLQIVDVTSGRHFDVFLEGTEKRESEAFRLDLDRFLAETRHIIRQLTEEVLEAYRIIRVRRHTCFFLIRISIQ